MIVVDVGNTYLADHILPNGTVPEIYNESFGSVILPPCGALWLVFQELEEHVNLLEQIEGDK